MFGNFLLVVLQLPLLWHIVYATPTAILNIIYSRLLGEETRKKNASHMAFAVFVTHTAKIASSCFHWAESGNYHVRSCDTTSRNCTSEHDCGWKMDENIIQIDKFWIIKDFLACRQQLASIFFACHFRKLPEINRQTGVISTPAAWSTLSWNFFIQRCTEDANMGCSAQNSTQENSLHLTSSSSSSSS